MIDGKWASSNTVLIHDCTFDSSKVYNYSIRCGANGIIICGTVPVPAAREATLVALLPIPVR